MRCPDGRKNQKKEKKIFSFLNFTFFNFILLHGYFTGEGIKLEYLWFNYIMLAFISVITVVLIFLNLDEPLVLVLDSMFLFLFAIVIFANIYSFYGLVDGTVLDAETGLEVAKITHDKYDTFYFSIVTWTTLGYGDWQPTQSVKIFAAVQALVGMYSTALLFGLFTYSFGLRNKRDS